MKCRSELDTRGPLVKYCACNVARPGTGRGIGGNLVVLCRCRACSFSRRPFYCIFRGRATSPLTRPAALALDISPTTPRRRAGGGVSSRPTGSFQHPRPHRSSTASQVKPLETPNHTHQNHNPPLPPSLGAFSKPATAARCRACTAATPRRRPSRTSRTPALAN